MCPTHNIICLDHLFSQVIQKVPHVDMSNGPRWENQISCGNIVWLVCNEAETGDKMGLSWSTWLGFAELGTTS